MRDHINISRVGAHSLNEPGVVFARTGVSLGAFSTMSPLLHCCASNNTHPRVGETRICCLSSSSPALKLHNFPSSYYSRLCRRLHCPNGKQEIAKFSLQAQISWLILMPRWVRFKLKILVLRTRNNDTLNLPPFRLTQDTNANAERLHWPQISHLFLYQILLLFYCFPSFFVSDVCGVWHVADFELLQYNYSRDWMWRQDIDPVLLGQTIRTLALSV